MAMMKETKFVPPEKELKVDSPAVALWRVLIEPYQMPDRIGLIELPDEVKNNAGVLMNVGKVVQLGDLAFQSNTQSGLKLSDCSVARSIQPGQWVLYGKYAGQQIHMRDGRKFIVLNDDEIIGRIDDPTQYQMYV